jgi:hypothetical protein
LGSFHHFIRQATDHYGEMMVHWVLAKTQQSSWNLKRAEKSLHLLFNICCIHFHAALFEPGLTL